MKTNHLIVVGGGVGGAAAALRAAQYDLSTGWILGDRDTHKTSRAAYVMNIDNMIGIHPAIVQGKSAELLRADNPEAAAQIEDAHMHISTKDLVANARARITADYSGHVRQVKDRAVEASATKGGFRVNTAKGEVYEAAGGLTSTE